jgi:hypothetical protein
MTLESLTAIIKAKVPRLQAWEIKGLRETINVAMSISPSESKALLARTRALEAMLKKHEWYDDFYCQECSSTLGPIEHAPGCQLAKLLEGIE